MFVEQTYYITLMIIDFEVLYFWIWLLCLLVGLWRGKLPLLICDFGFMTVLEFGTYDLLFCLCLWHFWEKFLDREVLHDLQPFWGGGIVTWFGGSWLAADSVAEISEQKSQKYLGKICTYPRDKSKYSVYTDWPLCWLCLIRSDKGSFPDKRPWLVDSLEW